MLNFLIHVMPWVALASWAFLLFLVVHAIIHAGSEVHTFWLSTFREDNGNGSYARVISAALFFVMSGLIVYCVIRQLPMPFPLSDATTYALSPYVANKVTNKLADAAAQVFGKGGLKDLAQPPQ